MSDCMSGFAKALQLDSTLTKCMWVQQNCGDATELVPFPQFFYCDVNQSSIALIMMICLVSFVCFHMLGSTAENYLSPALSQLSDILGCSETLAGVTLLALGNGAPDVITAIVAGGDAGQEGGSPAIIIGSIFGAGLFVTTLTLSRVIKEAGEIKIKPAFFLRDSMFYLLSVLLLIIYSFVGKITAPMAGVFLVIYVIYIGFVVFQELQMKNQAQKQAVADAEGNSDRGISMSEEFKTNLSIQTIDFEKLDQKEISEMIQEAFDDGSSSLSSNIPGTLNLSEHLQSDHYKPLVNDEYQQNEINRANSKYNYQQTPSTRDGILHSYRIRQHNLKLQLMSFQDEWNDMEIYEKIIFLYEIPVNFIRDLTVPPCEDENWSQNKGVVVSFIAPIFLIFMTNNIDMEIGGGFYVWMLSLILSFFFAIYLWKNSHRQTVPSFIWVFCIFGFINSILWISLAAQIMIDFLNFIEILTQIDQTYLGMTFLAYGNSASDYFANPILAREGLGVMAMTGCFSGQLFNFLLGFGTAMFLAALKSGQVPLNLFGHETNAEQEISNVIAITVMFCLLISLILTILIAKAQDYKFTAKLSSFYQIYYIVFFVAVTIMALACDIVRKPED